VWKTGIRFGLGVRVKNSRKWDELCNRQIDHRLWDKDVGLDANEVMLVSAGQDLSHNGQITITIPALVAVTTVKAG
jgi:hypothetical protein